MTEWEAENNPDFQLKRLSGRHQIRDSNPERERDRPKLAENGGFLWTSEPAEVGFCSHGPPTRGHIVNRSTSFWKFLQGNSLSKERLPWHSTEGRPNGIVR